MKTVSRRRDLVLPDVDLLALREEMIGAVFQYLCERLPEYLWNALEIAVEGWPPHVAFGGSHCEHDRFVCLTIDRRVLDCAAGEPAHLLRRLDLAQVEAALAEGDATRPVAIELD